MWRKGTLLHCLWKYRLVWALWKTIWNFLKKLKPELPFDPAIPLLGIWPKNPETPIQKTICTPIFIAALFTKAKFWKQPKCPSVDEWIKRLWYIYTIGYYLTLKKKELLPFVTAWISLQIIMLSEINESENDKYSGTLVLINLFWNAWWVPKLIRIEWWSIFSSGPAPWVIQVLVSGTSPKQALGAETVFSCQNVMSTRFNEVGSWQILRYDCTLWSR